MSNDKMREEFERTNGHDHRRQPPKGNNYIDPMAQADWQSFRKGWVQSRQALVIELPKPEVEIDSDEDYEVYEQQECLVMCESYTLNRCRKAIEAAGLKVKP